MIAALLLCPAPLITQRQWDELRPATVRKLEHYTACDCGPDGANDWNYRNGKFSPSCDRDRRKHQQKPKASRRAEQAAA